MTRAINQSIILGYQSLHIEKNKTNQAETVFLRIACLHEVAENEFNTFAKCIMVSRSRS